MTEAIKVATRNWVERIVIDLNLCPFAQREWIQSRVRLQVCLAQDEGVLLEALAQELELLTCMPEVETTLLVHPNTLTSFDDYNQFLNLSDALLGEMELEGVYQIASFHPNYQFANTSVDDSENYTNRSPYPMLHILREASLERAIDAHDDVSAIPEMNIEQLKLIGSESMRTRLDDCFE